MEDEKVIFDMEHFVTRTADQVKFDTARYKSGLKNSNGGDVPAFTFWSTSRRRRQYKGRKFIPGGTMPTCTTHPAPGKSLDGEYVNLWRGYGCEPIKGDVAAIKFLIHHLCAGDAVEIDFMTKRFAIKLQKPWLKIPTFQCVVTDAEGSGKSQLGKFIAGLHGVHGKMVTDAEVDSQFHDWCKDGLTFAVCEEGNLKDKKGAANRLKAMVSLEMQTVNPKGKPSYYIENYLDLYFTANEFNALYVRNDRERRLFLAYHPGVPPLDSERAKRLQHWYDHKGKEAMLHYFLNEVDTEGFDPYAAAPRTSGKTLMAEVSMSPAEDFVAELMADAVGAPAKPLYSFPALTAKFNDDPKQANRLNRLLSLALIRAECPHRRLRVREGGGAQNKLALYALYDMKKWWCEPDQNWATQWELQQAGEPSGGADALTALP